MQDRTTPQRTRHGIKAGKTEHLPLLLRLSSCNVKPRKRCPLVLPGRLNAPRSGLTVVMHMILEMKGLPGQRLPVWLVLGCLLNVVPVVRAQRRA